jgi:hypothetical protein
MASSSYIPPEYTPITSEDIKKLLNKSLFQDGELRFFEKHYSIDPKLNRIVFKGKFSSDNLLFEESDKIEYDEIIFDGGKFEKIEFIGGTFKKVVFRNGIYNGYVSIRGGTFDNIVLLGGEFKHWFGTLDGINETDELDNPLAQQALNIGSLSIEGGSFVNNIWIEGGKFNTLSIRSVSLLKLHITPKLLTMPHIDVIILSVYLFKDSIIQLGDITLERLEFVDFTNNGTITISNLKLTKQLNVINSDLGKLTFINCDFSKNTLVFQSSKITDIALVGSLFPENIIPRVDLTEFPKQKRLAWGQIKKVYENRGDLVESGRYLAKEMNLHLDSLSWRRDFWEILNLFVNKWSNNHGQSWKRGFISTLIIAILFYSMYCYSLGYSLNFSFSLASKDTFWELVSFLPEFINPIHKADYIANELQKYEQLKSGLSLTDLKDYPLPRNARFIDTISRIFVGYCVFQLIAAFRKYGKKL